MIQLIKLLSSATRMKIWTLNPLCQRWHGHTCHAYCEFTLLTPSRRVACMYMPWLLWTETRMASHHAHSRATGLSDGVCFSPIGAASFIW